MVKFKKQRGKVRGIEKQRIRTGIKRKTDTLTYNKL